MKKLALYNPYLDIMGGGEKHILSILKVLEKEYDIHIFWDKDLSKEIEDKFALKFDNKLNFLPNIFINQTFPFSTIKTFQTLKLFNLFFYVTNGSYFFSSAKKNFVFCMYPQINLYNMNILNKLKTSNYQFISNSKFTSTWLTKWGIKNTVLYPYIDDIFFQSPNVKKEKIILSVGRFYKHLHSKQHETTIRIFQEMKKEIKELKDYKLILVGSVKKEDQEYFNELKKSVSKVQSIELCPNVSFDELDKLYKLATFYLHMAGYDVDENQHPEQVEHLGITPLEAMASGCITYCYNAGGPKEIIKDGENGFLFDSQEELFKKIDLGFKNKDLRNNIVSNAKKFVKENFSYNIFQKRVKQLISTA
jgi:glycosyltransferase involved in cell wall biosynthesis